MISISPDTRSKLNKSSAEEIAASLEARIQSGELAPGDSLPTERALCEEFSTSRPTVREALLLLQGRGYATLGSGRRPKAVKPTLDDILTAAGKHISNLLGDADSGAHLEQMRQFIEAGAARIAAAQATNIQLQQIQTALAQNIDSINTDLFPQTDIAFHRAIVAVVGNPVLLKLHDMFVSKMLANRPIRTSGENDNLVAEEHKQICDAIMRGDGLNAAELMDKHLMRSYRSRLMASAQD